MKRVSFKSDESGAVTVDWVVLTAGLVGLGIATMTVVSSGVQDTTGDTRAQLDGQIIYSSFATTSEDFANGVGSWTGGSAMNKSGFGDFLYITPSSGLEATSQTFDIPEGTEVATATFDVIALDSLDGNQGEGVSIYANGQLIATSISSGQGSLQWSYETVPGVNLTINETSSGSNIGGGFWDDGIYSATLTVDDPSETLSIGFGGNYASNHNDEGAGIDNFTLQTAGLGS